MFNYRLTYDVCMDLSQHISSFNLSCAVSGDFESERRQGCNSLSFHAREEPNWDCRTFAINLDNWIHMETTGGINKMEEIITKQMPHRSSWWLNLQASSAWTPHTTPTPGPNELCHPWALQGDALKCVIQDKESAQDNHLGYLSQLGQDLHWNQLQEV